MKRNLTFYQCATMIMMIIAPTAFLIVPTATLNYASQDAWMSVLLSTAAAALLMAVLGVFARSNREGVPFLDWLAGRIGRPAAAAAGLALAVHYFATTSKALHEFIQFLSAEVMPNTPNPVLYGVTILVMIYAAAEGLETMGRICLLATLMSAPMYALSMLLLYANVHPNFMLPIGENSFREIVQGSITPFGLMSEGAAILLFAPYMAKPEQAPKAAFWGVLLVGAELLLAVLQALLVFGPNIVKDMRYPSFTLISVIEFGRFLERVDLFFVMYWTVTVFIKLSLLLFVAVHCLERTFRVRAGQPPYLFAAGLLLLLDASLTWRRDYKLHSGEYISNLALISLNVLLPLALWFACLAFRKGRRGIGGTNA
ncbi:endospore germination permease [Cohnella xylanilytica]|uniref:Endospore germination permease n=1 Tax=Cohnella xylanilytica TaxID=557555 RepID=A0A841U5U0_9BACL|nr:endospore germination permease [Cohnella xylanilytica]MBB6696037.1 endospore germination permease [Cohnella xylanilytica]